ncbi:MBG domain-containing protein, partial [Methylobacterium oryzihabitans]|uniref:MBG domain-containing protein n=1 Tax=Methylobacterium oryzihabitans TaxID=2499852 RepID=UPI001AEE3F33
GTFASRNAGTGIAVALSGLGLTGADAGNYRLSLPTLSAAISPAVLTYTADPAARIYGAANPAPTGTVSGFVAGESQGSATTGTLAFATGATPSSHVGTYAITGGGLTAIDGNYRFVQAAGNASALTVDPALLTVTGTKTYDATAGFG